MQTICGCLNIIDDAIVEHNGKYTGISNLESIHKCLLEKRQSDFIEDRVALSNVLGQIHSIIENHYQFVEEDIKSEYIVLRKLILVWLIECSTEPKVDKQ